MTIGISYSLVQVARESNIENDIFYKKYRFLDNRRNNINLDNKSDLDKLIELSTLQYNVKNVRLSYLSSYVENSDGKIDKNKLKNILYLLERYKDQGIDVLLVLLHFTYPRNWVSIFDKDFLKYFINHIENVKEIFGYVKHICPVNEPINTYFMNVLINPSGIFYLNRFLENVEEIQGYIYDEFKREKIIHFNVYSLYSENIGITLNNLLKSFENQIKKLRNYYNVLDINYYGTFGFNLYGKNYLGSKLLRIINAYNPKDIQNVIFHYKKLSGVDNIWITETGLYAKNYEEEKTRYKYIEETIKYTKKISSDIPVFIWTFGDIVNEWGKEHGGGFGICYDGNNIKKKICENYIELFKKYN
ncbi:hypothetical protein [Candidatus Nanobsidianus stetteri]|uniref:Uncharacterized protein n=1 Tax=Nanobsidianus stetteri TaxID=1294122 RepID=A0A2T9WLA8_NANST|nr:hypothetical protein [Candidatus Nanobsidianus stetteri]MCC5447240.1 hypothetical protein [Candidatus Nanobsidianus stetteri]